MYLSMYLDEFSAFYSRFPVTKLAVNNLSGLLWLPSNGHFLCCWVRER